MGGTSIKKIHSSCEIEYFVETRLCKLCVILRSRVLLGVCPHYRYRSATPLGTADSVACTRVNRVILVIYVLVVCALVACTQRSRADLTELDGYQQLILGWRSQPNGL